MKKIFNIFTATIVLVFCNIALSGGVSGGSGTLPDVLHIEPDMFSELKESLLERDFVITKNSESHMLKYVDEDFGSLTYATEDNTKLVDIISVEDFSLLTEGQIEFDESLVIFKMND